MNITQAAERLELTPHYLRQLLLKGKFQASKSESGAWDISELDIERYLDSKTPKAAAVKGPQRPVWWRGETFFYTHNPIERYYSVRELANALDLSDERIIVLLENDKLECMCGGAYNIGVLEIKEGVGRVGRYRAHNRLGEKWEVR